MEKAEEEEKKTAGLGRKALIASTAVLGTGAALVLAGKALEKKGLRDADPNTIEGGFHTLRQNLKNPKTTRKDFVAGGIKWTNNIVSGKSLPNNPKHAPRYKAAIEGGKKQGLFSTEALTKQYSTEYDTYRTKKKLPLI